MAKTLHKVSYFCIDAPNRPGQGARFLAALREADVNLLAISGFPEGRTAQIDFVPAEPARFKAVARKLGLKLSARKFAFLVQGEDKVGALTDMLAKLAAAKINITALTGVTAGAGRFGAIFWVKPKFVARTAKLLHAK